jgi:hypothetical protein
VPPVLLCLSLHCRRGRLREATLDRSAGYLPAVRTLLRAARYRVMAPLTCLAQQWDAVGARTAGAYPISRLTHGAPRNHALYLHVQPCVGRAMRNASSCRGACRRSCRLTIGTRRDIMRDYAWSGRGAGSGWWLTAGRGTVLGYCQRSAGDDQSSGYRETF